MGQQRQSGHSRTNCRAYAKNWPIIPNHSSSTISSQPLTKIFPVVQQPQAAHRRNPAKPQNPPHHQNRRVASGLGSASLACWRMRPRVRELCRFISSSRILFAPGRPTGRDRLVCEQAALRRRARAIAPLPKITTVEVVEASLRLIRCFSEVIQRCARQCAASRRVVTLCPKQAPWKLLAQFSLSREHDVANITA